jgi:GNAT superfamily N-acetyltransferase
VNVRPARGDDFESVSALLERAGRPAVTRSTRDDLKVLYELQVVDPNAHHIVIEDDERTVVGFLSLHFRVRLNFVAPEAWIGDVFVLEDVRLQGYGAALMGEATHRAREHGCFRICSESGYKRAESHQLFRSVGLRDRGKYFERTLN